MRDGAGLMLQFETLAETKHEKMITYLGAARPA